MTPEQINVTIAKAVGLHVVSDGVTHCLTPCNLGGVINSDGKFLTTVPNYYGDRNAIGAVVKTLTGEQTVTYVKELRIIIERTDDLRTVHWFAVVEASAAQRAEAYLKTIDKWEYPKAPA